jgi:hypothetical protein
MLKPMVKNQSMANRNLSLAILYREQFNHLPFATPSWAIPPVQGPLASPHYTQDLDGHKYSFLHPRRDGILSPDEASHLVRYYANIFGCTQREINLNDEFNWEIVKWARCLLTGDADSISCQWRDLQRDSGNERASYIVRLSQLNNDGGSITQYAKVIHFFVHKFRDVERMLAYVQI